MMMKRNYEKGLTLIEILISISILSIILVTFLTFFTQSANVNKTSKNIGDATYVAENCMEEISNTISKTTQPTNITNFTLNGYTQKTGTSTYEKFPSGHYVFVELVPQTSPLITVKVKVYKDSSKTKLESQMEMLLSWKQ
jgi:prepilin-type N-terminal cleavage/methylation domain-containing protein